MEGAPEGKTPKTADPNERIDGLRAWLGQVERRLGVRTYIGAALAVVALAAGGVAIYLALDTRDDAATEADIQDLREELTGVRETASEAARQDVEQLTQTIERLENRIGKLDTDQASLKDEVRVTRDDIQDLRDQISELETDGGGGGGAGGP